MIREAGPVVEAAARPARRTGGWHEPRWLSRLAAPGDRVTVLGGSVVAVVTVGVLLLVASRLGPDTLVPIVVFVGLVMVSLPICLAASRRPRDVRLRWLLVAALILKLGCAGPRYLVNEVTYDGSSDAGVYHHSGAAFYDNVREGNWSLEGSPVEGLTDETQAVAFVTGAIYLVVGTSQMSGYLVFTWISWVGLMLFLRAFRVARPDVSPHLAAVLLFALPSTLYWSSSIGKDALMVFGLGLMTLGIARAVCSSRPLLALLWLTLGGVVVAAVRPHLLLVAAVGGLASVMVRRPAPSPHGPPTPSRAGLGLAARVAVLAGLAVMLVVGMGRLSEVIGAPDEDDGWVSITQALQHTTDRTSIGGSAFDARAVSSPGDFPVAAVSVLYRPFLFEARNVPSAVAALEGTLLIGLTLAAARWLWRVGPTIRRDPFAAYCAAFSVAFIVAFSNVGNAGILARQRVQLFPVLMLLIAATAAASRAREGAVATAGPFVPSRATHLIDRRIPALR